jgi:hypothetical protein
MNRKNLTAAVLAGLAGVAGIAGTAQAVNMNPDGLGQVLIYPYYTANAGNQTALSVVNTTDQAKAVKVRFLEGFNSREVLDFNLYLSEHDVWVASVAEVDGVPSLKIYDNSCTVPYLYETKWDAAHGAGVQEFLDIAYTDNGTINGVSYDFNDMGPGGIGRAAEGHFEIIEMGAIDNDSDVGMAVTHDQTTGMPADCAMLTEYWTRSTDADLNGQWITDSNMYGVGTTDIMRNSGGLFGGAAVINTANGSMFSYDAIALQGFDKNLDGMGLNFEPGDIYPSLNSGDQNDAWVFFGPPTNEAANLTYNGDIDHSVDAVSAVFMHSNIVNEYVVMDALNAATEWVVTFPTKNFYADWHRMCEEGLVSEVHCEGDATTDPVTLPSDPYARAPFTKYFGQMMDVDDGMGDVYDAPDCEVVYLKTWNRDEDTFVPGTSPDPDPVDAGPVVSPSLPPCDPGTGDDCPIHPTGSVPFQLCNEVNVLRAGERALFNTPTFPAETDELLTTLLITFEDEFEAGWGRIDFSEDSDRVDEEGLVGLPVTGFAAFEYQNDYVDFDSGIKARYGGLFRHKGLVSRTVND